MSKEQQLLAEQVASTTEQISEHVFVSTVTTYVVSIKECQNSSKYKTKASKSVNTHYDPIQSVFVAVFGNKDDQTAYLEAIKTI